MKLLLLPWLLVVGSMASCAQHGRESSVQQPARERSTDLRIGTYNVYVGAHDLPGTLAVLRKMEADVIALQEVTPATATALGSALAAEYPHRYFSSQLGLLSRFSLHHLQARHSRLGINGFLFAVVDHPQGRIQFVDLHLDPLRLWTTRDLLTLPFQFGRHRRIQQDELRQVRENLAPGLPTILAGDFNRVDDAAIRSLRAEGFTDSFAAVVPRPDRASTLHFSLLGLHLGRRIDFVFHDASFHTVSSRVLPGLPSDHDALVSRLAWKKAGVKP